MKNLILASASVLALSANAALATDDNMQSMMGAGFGFVLGGTVDVTNIGAAVGDVTSVESASTKLLEGGFTGTADNDDASFGAMLNLYGGTQGISTAVSGDEHGNGSIAGTSESGMVLLTGGGNGYIWLGESD